MTVKDLGGSNIFSYQYDGLGRRISEAKSGTTTDLYVSTADQVLEERVSGTATAQYVWSPVYVDALVLRDRDSDANGSLDELPWVQQDANWNVTALLDNSVLTPLPCLAQEEKGGLRPTWCSRIATAGVNQLS